MSGVLNCAGVYIRVENKCHKRDNLKSVMDDLYLAAFEFRMPYSQRYLFEHLFTYLTLSLTLTITLTLLGLTLPL